eukprot:5550169-Pyramimonas_sp.AAC.2
MARLGALCQRPLARGYLGALSRCVFFFNRPGFCVMRAVHEFVRSSYDTPDVLWRSCRYECWLMAVLCLHLQSPLSLPRACEVVATDASTSVV